MKRTGSWLATASMALVLILAACSPAASVPPTSAPAAKPTTAPAPSGGAPTAAPAAQPTTAPAAQPAGAEKTIVIGAALPLTGDVSNEGKFQRDGYELWKDTVNGKGGIDVGGTKYKVDIKYYDYKSDTSTAVKLVEKLITEDKAQFIFGPFGSGATVATSAVTEKYQIPLLSPSASSAEVYSKGAKYLFGILVSNDVVGAQSLDVAASASPKPQTMSIVARNDLFPKAVGQAMQAAAKTHGIEVLSYDEYPIGATDLSTPLLNAKSKNPDLLVGTGYENDLVLMTKQAKELKLNPKLFIQTAGPAYPSFTVALKADANYIVTPTWWAPEAKHTDNGKLWGSSADYAKAFKEKNNYDADYISAASSACGAVLQAAIEKAGSIDPAKVRDAMASGEFPTFYGPIKFDQSGQNVGTGVTMLQIQDQKLIAIAPKDAATGSLKYPTPPWDQR